MPENGTGTRETARRSRSAAPRVRGEMTLLSDQVCIVTGAGQGLGRAIALEMAKEGAAVALLERNADTLEQTAKAIGSNAIPYRLDITDYNVYAKVVADVVAKHKKIDV